MIHLGQWQNQKITLSLKSNSLTLSRESKSGTAVFSWDLAGRLWTAMVDNISYRRGLDGKLIAKWISPTQERGRRWCSMEESQQIIGYAQSLADDLLTAFQMGKIEIQPPENPDLTAALTSAAKFTWPQSLNDAARYAQTYKPVGILPPDQYMAVVLQAAEGCSFNTCTFCDFYKSRPFHIKTPQEFSDHALAVREYLGKGLSLRRTIFLGDANALVIPMKRLVPLLEITHKTYAVEKLGGIFAFLDGFSGEKKTAADYQTLAQMQLKRVYTGVETGSDELLRSLKKPGSAADAVHTVAALKQAGISVGVIFLLGVGGNKFAAQHVRETIRMINSMQLDLEDIIYFSELVENEGMEYTQSAYTHNYGLLNGAERAAQAEEITAALQFSESSGVPHISRYDIREFVY